MSEPLRPPPPPTWHDRLGDLRARLPESRATLVAGAAGLVALFVVVFLVLRPSSPAPITLPRAAAPAAPATTEAPAPLVVYVAGAVVRPGLYRLAPGARAGEAVGAAGGPAGDADLDAVNLAAKVGDGERLYIARKGEAPPPAVPGGSGSAGGGGATTSGPLDVNTASLEQLETLPGVGPATAQSIVSHRQQHGRFRSVDELLDVRGIGPAKLEALRGLVRV